MILKLNCSGIIEIRVTNNSLLLPAKQFEAKSGFFSMRRGVYKAREEHDLLGSANQAIFFTTNQ